MPQIILYRVNGSCSMVAHVLLKQLNISFKTVRLQAGADGYEAADGSFTHAEYMNNINPTGYVPALCVDGDIITENPAIFRFISEVDPRANLLGGTAVERARVEEWLVWLSGTLHGLGFGAHWRPARFTGDPEAHDQIKKRGMEVILQCFDRIEKRIQGPYAVDGPWTPVDIFLHVFWRWGHEVGIDMDRDYPKYRELAKRVEKMESLRAVMLEEKQLLQFPEDA